MMQFSEMTNSSAALVGNGTNLLNFPTTTDLVGVPMEYSFLLPVTDHAARMLLYGAISGMGIITNSLSIAAMIKGKLCRSWTYAIVLNITVTDLIVCMAMVTCFLPNLIKGRYIFSVWTCRFRSAVVFTAGLCSVMCYVLLAVQRFLVVVFNLTNLKLFRIEYLPVILVTFWIIALSAYCPFWIYGDLYVLFWPDNCSPYSNTLISIIQGISIIFVFIPLCFILLLYVTIYIVVRRSSARVQIHNNSSNSHGKSGLRKDVRMAFVLFFLYFMFAVAYVPYVTSFFVFDVLAVTQLKTFLLIGMFTVVTVSALNPFFYALLFKPLQDVYLNILRKHTRATTRINVSGMTGTTTTTAT